MAVSSNSVAVRVLEAIGLPVSGCLSVTMELKAGDLATVTAVYAPTEGDMTQLVEVLRTLKAS